MPAPPSGAREPSAPVKKDDGFWRELRQDVRDYILHFDHETIEDLSRTAKGLANGLKGAWKSVRDIPAKVFNHPIIADKVAQQDRDFWSDFGQQAGIVVGFTAAGGHALSGALRLGSAVKKKNVGKALDGLVDIAAGSSLALAVAGLAGARAIVAPIASTVNLVRGVYNTATGFKRGDQRKQLQGALDVTRSIGSIGRLLKRSSPIFKAAGIVFAPIAGGLQASRGVYDIATGLKNNDNKKELQGLADIAMAVGTCLAFASGAAVIPGVALAVAANIVKVGYQLSPKFRKRVDKTIDKVEPKLQKAVNRAESLAEPIVAAWQGFMGRFLKLDAASPDRYSKAQLAEITNLLHSDGRLNRDEHGRLRTNLESVGQKNDLPQRAAAPPTLRRAELLQELETWEKRVAFVSFMIVVADYDFEAKPEELAYLRQLSSDLGLSGLELDALLADRAEHKLKLRPAAELKIAV